MNFEEYLKEMSLGGILNHPVTKILAKATGADKLPGFKAVSNHFAKPDDKKKKAEERSHAADNRAGEADKKRDHAQHMKNEIEDARRDHKYHVGYIKQKYDTPGDRDAKKRAIEDAEDAHQLKIEAIRDRHK